MTLIFASVGKNIPPGKGNFANDVRVVQGLLNTWIEYGLLKGHVEKLVVDGDCGNLTKGAIKAFQTIVLGWKHPDIRVDPGGFTLKELTGPRAPKVGSKLPPNLPNPSSSVNYNPVEVLPNAVANFVTGGETSIWFIGSKAIVRSGEVWRSSNGERLVVAASYDSVCFIQLTAPQPGAKVGRLYCQHRLGFQQDVGIGAVASDIVDQTQTVRRLIELELHFMMGLGVATGGTFAWVFALFPGIGSFIRDNEKNFPKWINVVKIALQTRIILKVYTPTLYKKIFNFLLSETVSNLPEAMIGNPNRLAQTTGLIIGEVGKKAWLNKTAVVYFVLAILINVAVHALKSIPDAGKEMLQIVSKLREAGVAITEAEGKAIMQEVIKHAAIILPELQRLKDALANC